MQTETERRSQRSNEPDEATQHQLEQVLRDFDLDTCILADAKGNLLQAPGRNPGLERALAAEAPKLAQNSTCRLMFSRLAHHQPSIRPNQITACEFRLQGAAYYVVGVGAMSAMRDVGVCRAILGIRRIRRQASA